jgi:hypothetical protein
MTKAKKRAKKVKFDMGHSYQVQIEADGSAWRLKRRSAKKGEKRKWVKMGSGVIADDDPVLLFMHQNARPGTPLHGLKISLALQRGTALYNTYTKPPALSGPAEA